VTIDAEEALAWSLVDAIAPAPNRLDTVVERFVEAILAGGPQAIRLQKAADPGLAGIADRRGGRPRQSTSSAEAYATDEPRRMAGERLAAMRGRGRREGRR